MAMLPAEKQMVARLKGQPFALIGINSDGDRSVVNKILKQNGITWRQAIDGLPCGPLATQWGIPGWPTTYVLDGHGVIRYQELRDKDLDAAVETLLKGMTAGKQTG